MIQIYIHPHTGKQVSREHLWVEMDDGSTINLADTGAALPVAGDRSEDLLDAYRTFTIAVCKSSASIYLKDELLVLNNRIKEIQSKCDEDRN